jgi:cell division protein FtsB
MNKRRHEPKLARDKLTQASALVCLLVLGAMSLVGPSGFLAWSDNNRLLTERQAEVKQLMVQRDELRNRVALLAPGHTDSDLAGQLLRDDLNVVHPDELVMPIN